MKQTFHSGRQRKASSHKTNNRDGNSGKALNKNLVSVITGGGSIKSRPSNPRYQKTQNAKTSSGKVSTKKLNLTITPQDPRLNGHESAMSPAAVLKKIKRTVVKPSRWDAKSKQTVKDLRKYISKQGG